MITVESLLRSDAAVRGLAAPGMNPLVEAHALQEAQLLDVRFDALRGTAALLFELRTALQLDEGNTGVLLAWEADEISWSSASRDSRLRAWWVGGSVPETRGGEFTLRAALGMSGELTVRGRRAAFIAGDVPGLQFIPDYGVDDDETIRANLASWSSEFIPLRAVFLDHLGEAGT